MDISTKNKNRFLGFADTYEAARPRMPLLPIEIITQYLGGAPDLVVDLGCGTGLSTAIWQGHCNRVIGIEPSEDMLCVASKKADDAISFRKAFAHDTGLESGCADAVVCSQSFHWMNPDLTLAEINRILKTCGVFAAIDYDWPPICNTQAEMAYNELFTKVDAVEKSHPDLSTAFSRWDKNKHLSHIQGSGYFKYCREVVFLNTEPCDAERFILIALSQGGLQSILKKDRALIQDEIDLFSSLIRGIFQDKRFEVRFCYRMRIGVK